MTNRPFLGYPKLWKPSYGLLLSNIWRIATIHELGNPDSQLVGTHRGCVQTLVEMASTLSCRILIWLLSNLRWIQDSLSCSISEPEPWTLEIHLMDPYGSLLNGLTKPGSFYTEFLNSPAPGSLELLLESSPWNLRLSSGKNGGIDHQNMGTSTFRRNQM